MCSGQGRSAVRQRRILDMGAVGSTDLRMKPPRRGADTRVGIRLISPYRKGDGMLQPGNTVSAFPAARQGLCNDTAEALGQSRNFAGRETSVSLCFCRAAVLRRGAGRALPQRRAETVCAAYPFAGGSCGSSDAGSRNSAPSRNVTASGAGGVFPCASREKTVRS